MKFMRVSKIDEINYIIYNNRSTDLVLRFVGGYDVITINDIESKINFIKKQYATPYGVNIDHSWCDISASDILFSNDDFNGVKSLKMDSYEYSYLLDRGFTIDMVNKYGILPIDAYQESDYDIIGVTLHPSIRKVFDNQVCGSFVIPFYNECGDVINYCIRRTIDGPLKYSMAIPDYGVFGLECVSENEEFWITEGVFDAIAIREQGYNAVSVSSAMFSPFQIIDILNKKPKRVNIFADYDYTGLRSADILKRLLSMYGVSVGIYQSMYCKDAFEHFIERGYSMNDVEETMVTKELLSELEPDNIESSKNLLEYLKCREI